jgi:recombinational DNA repair protein (RecF pathway)
LFAKFSRDKNFSTKSRKCVKCGRVLPANAFDYTTQRICKRCQKKISIVKQPKKSGAAEKMVEEQPKKPDTTTVSSITLKITMPFAVSKSLSQLAANELRTDENQALWILREWLTSTQK